jgi:AraC-like DNA-binding protein
MIHPAPLDAFPMARTRNVDELAGIVASFYGDVEFDVLGRSDKFRVVANHCQLQTLGISYANHGAPIQITLPRFASFAQLFSLNGSAHVTSRSAEVDVTPGGSFVGSMDDALRLRYRENFDQLVLNIDALALTRKLEALLGESLREKLQFEPRSSLERPDVGHLHRAVLALIDRLGSAREAHHPVALAEFEQSILVSFLRGNVSNYHHLLERKPGAIGNWQLALAEDFIEANWDKPLSLEMLAAVTGASARSIFYYFRHARGHSPMIFVRLIRLRHAYRLLAQPTPATSVTGVAFACGFGNLGHFAHYYKQQYGEAPSNTLRRGQRAKL